jgi:hypothetical protein
MQPGDLFVIEHPGHLSRRALENIQLSAKQVLPEGVKVIVLEEGMRASLLRPQAIDLTLDGQAIGKAMVDAQRARGAV